MSSITTVTQLERLVGRRPFSVMMKSIPSLDVHCERLLALSPFAVLGYADAQGRARAMAVGGAPGFATPMDPNHLHLGLPPEELPALDPSAGVGMLFFMPGLGETLRVNGAARVEGDVLHLTVEEAFGHCAKALLRSDLWGPPLSPPEPEAAPDLGVGAGPLADPTLQRWLARAPLLVLTSRDADGRADASPKGDPPGFVRLDGEDVLIPDRPGNRRTDTFHNLLEQPQVALLALVPGETQALEISGRASLTTDPALLATMAVQGKTPKIALRLTADRVELRERRALAAARLWDPSRHVPEGERPRMAAVFSDHLKQSKEGGLAAAAVRTLASQRLVAWGLALNYEKHRY
ncbi:MAG: pyridoxamine 5'-phosphate oxidase family protein [Alphaproteobacteria bacterium]|nr:pyridoxamine 5'-phosphate oxidase family protein [Alphaproteobacteria bacterium]